MEIEKHESMIARCLEIYIFKISVYIFMYVYK